MGGFCTYALYDLTYSRTPRKRTPLGPPRSVRLRGVSANGGLKFQKELKGQEQ